MIVEPLADLRDPKTPAPVAADDRGRSAQRVMMQVTARSGGSRRRVTAAGRDIYAITAPIVVEAATRIVAGRVRTPTGALAAGQLFDAGDFLRALPLERLSIDDVRSEEHTSELQSLMRISDAVLCLEKNKN